MGFDLHYHEVRRLMYLVESSETSVMNAPGAAGSTIEVASHPRIGPSFPALAWCQGEGVRDGPRTFA